VITAAMILAAWPAVAFALVGAWVATCHLARRNERSKP
jgi:hypothetical protein